MSFFESPSPQPQDSEWKAPNRVTEALRNPELQTRAGAAAREIGSKALDGALDEFTKVDKHGKRKVRLTRVARAAVNPTGAARRVATGAIKGGAQEARGQALDAGRSAIDYGMNQLGSTPSAPAIESSPDRGFSAWDAPETHSFASDPFSETAPAPDWGVPRSPNTWESAPSTQGLALGQETGWPSTTTPPSETSPWGTPVIDPFGEAAPAALPQAEKKGLFRRNKKDNVAPIAPAPTTPDPFGRESSYDDSPWGKSNGW